MSQGLNSEDVMSNIPVASEAVGAFYSIAYFARCKDFLFDNYPLEGDLADILDGIPADSILSVDHSAPKCSTTIRRILGEIASSYFSKDALLTKSDKQKLLQHALNDEPESLKRTALDLLADDARYRRCGDNPNLVQLAKAILSIKSDDTVADLCSGTGQFVSSCEETQNLFGYDIDYDFVNRSIVVCALKGIYSAEIEQANVMSLPAKLKFDKIFCHYPWNINTRFLGDVDGSRWEPLPIENSKRKLNWMFIAKTLNLLKENGIAVIYTHDVPLYSNYDRMIRSLAVSRGLIKAVIALPQVDKSVQINTSILVLSYGNKGIKFIDARSRKTNNKIRGGLLSSDDVSFILNEYDCDNGEHSCFVKNEDILEAHADIMLAPGFYLYGTSGKVQVADGKTIEEVSERIIPGAVNNEGLLTKDPSSGIYVLRAKNIADGAIDFDSLSFIDKSVAESLSAKFPMLLLEDGDVVMTNKSTTIKVALVETKGKKIALFGSLYAIRPKKDMVIPEYLASFLNSRAGQAALSSIQTGTIITNISLASLRMLEVPAPSIEKQMEMVKNIRIDADMLEYAKKQVESIRNRMANYFSDMLKEN